MRAEKKALKKKKKVHGADKRKADEEDEREWDEEEEGNVKPRQGLHVRYTERLLIVPQWP